MGAAEVGAVVTGTGGDVACACIAVAAALLAEASSPQPCLARYTMKTSKVMAAVADARQLGAGGGMAVAVVTWSAADGSVLAVYTGSASRFDEVGLACTVACGWIASGSDAAHLIAATFFAAVQTVAARLHRLRIAVRRS